MSIRQKYKSFIENRKKKELFQALTNHGLSKFETWCHFWKVNSVVDATNHSLTFIDKETFKEFLIQIVILQVDKKKYPHIDQDFYKNIRFLINRNERPEEQAYFVKDKQLNIKTKELERKYKYGLPPIQPKTIWEKIKYFFSRIIPFIQSIFCSPVIKNPETINSLFFIDMNHLMNMAPKPMNRLELNKKVTAVLNDLKSGVKGFFQKVLYFFMKFKMKKQIEKDCIVKNISKVEEFNARDFEKNYSFKKEPIPFDFKNELKNTVQDEDLELVVDRDEEQHVDQEVAIDEESAVNLLQEVDTDIVLAVDLTKRIDISKVTTDNITYENNELIKEMLRSVSRGYTFNGTGVSFISEEAQKALSRARESDYTTANKNGVAAETSIMGVLPMGFFVQEKMVDFQSKAKKERVLCYSEEYRQEQKLKKEPVIDIITDSKSKPRQYLDANVGHPEWDVLYCSEDVVKKSLFEMPDQSYFKIFNGSWTDVDKKYDIEKDFSGFYWNAGTKCDKVLQKVFLTMKKRAKEKKDFAPMNQFFKLISDFLDRTDIDDTEKQNFIILMLRTSLLSFEYIESVGTDYASSKKLDFDKTSLFQDAAYLKSLKKVFSYQPEKIKTSIGILENHNQTGAQASIIELQNIVDRYYKILSSLKVTPPSGVPKYLWEFPTYIALISGTRACDLEYLSDVPSDHKSATFLRSGGYHFVHKDMMANKKTDFSGMVSYGSASKIEHPDLANSFYQYFWYFFHIFNDKESIGLDDSSVRMDFFSDLDFYNFFLLSVQNRQSIEHYLFNRYNDESTLIVQKAFYLRFLAQYSSLSLKEAFSFWDKSIQEDSSFHPLKNTEKFLVEMKKEVVRVALLRKEEKAGFDFDDSDATLLDRLKAESLEKSFVLYDIDKLNTFLAHIGISQKTDKDALVDRFAKINKEIEGLKEKTAAELSKLLKAAFKADPKKDVESVLALLALSSFRVSSNSGEPVQLRLEQMVAILLSMSNNPTLFQIDTGEGKTLILNIVSLLYVSQGKKVKIITHNEYEAKKGPDQMRALCTLTGVSVGENKDIQYIEATKAIQAYLKDNQEAAEAPKDNSGAIILVDEVDQVLRHLPALSSTHISMRKQNDTKTKEYYEFLKDLLKLVTEWGAQKEKLDLVDFIRDRVFVDEDDESSNSFWVDNLASDELLKKNIENAQTVLNGYKKNKDYVIENKCARLVQKSVSGRRADKNAQLANGLQAFLIAKELLEGEELELKGETDIIATGSIFDVMRHAEKTMGYTGTAGSGLVQTQIETALASGKPEQPKTFVFPRAERKKPKQFPRSSILSEEEKQKPFHKTDSEKEVKRVFSKRHDFPPQFLASKKEQWMLLLDRIKSIKEADSSVIVFFETIAEVVEFNRFLETNQIADNQLYHDAVDMDEKELILHVSAKKTVTIATSAAGRGIDFKLAKNLDKEMKAKALYAIVTHPALEPVLNQALARVGRNEDLGVTEQIYAREDFVEGFKPHDYVELPATKAAITPCRWHQEFSEQQEASYTERLSNKQQAKPFWRPKL